LPYCPYCTHDVSPTALACPNCGDNLRRRRLLKAINRYWHIPGLYVVSAFFFWSANVDFLEISSDIQWYCNVTGIVAFALATLALIVD